MCIPGSTSSVTNEWASCWWTRGIQTRKADGRTLTSVGTRTLEVVVTYPFKIVETTKDPGLGLPDSLKGQEKLKTVFYLKICILLCAPTKTVYSFGSLPLQWTSLRVEMSYLLACSVLENKLRNSYYYRVMIFKHIFPPWLPQMILSAKETFRNGIMFVWHFTFSPEYFFSLVLSVDSVSKLTYRVVPAFFLGLGSASQSTPIVQIDHREPHWQEMTD